MVANRATASQSRRTKKRSAADDSDQFSLEIEEAMREEQRKSSPSPKLVVYCEQHLGVKMVPAMSWVIGQHAEKSADVNRLDFWRCPRSDCDRCYDPMLFGYFSHKGEMGSRIEPNPLKQRRCGIHVETPFLYIGKVDQGRQFLCPFHKCDERGDWVSAVVVDEELAVSDDPLCRLGKTERQQLEEMSIFNSFAVASGLAIDEGSAVNAFPRNPDIQCTISSQLYWFELGQIISEEVAEKTNTRRGRIGGGLSFSQERPFIEIARKKAAKTYETQGAPVDLILHFDLRLGTQGVVRRMTEKHKGLFNSLVGEGPFSRVWLYDDWTKTVVSSHSRS